MTDRRRVKGSFRDPSGFVFDKDGIVYRQVNPSYRSNYDHFIGSGLYADLTEGQLLVPHVEEGDHAPGGPRLTRSSSRCKFHLSRIPTNGPSASSKMPHC